MYASRAQHHRIATTARCTRCDGSLPSPLHLAIKRNGFQMMFPPAATWTRAVGLPMLIVKYCCRRRQSSNHARSLGAPLWPIGAGLGAGNKTTSDFDILLGGRGSSTVVVSLGVTALTWRIVMTRCCYDTSTDLTPEQRVYIPPHLLHRSSHDIVCQSYTVPCTSSARTVTVCRVITYTPSRALFPP